MNNRLQFSKNGMLLWQLPFGILRQKSFSEQGNVKSLNRANLYLQQISGWWGTVSKQDPRLRRSCRGSVCVPHLLEKRCI